MESIFINIEGPSSCKHFDFKVCILVDFSDVLYPTSYRSDHKYNSVGVNESRDREQDAARAAYMFPKVTSAI